MENNDTFKVKVKNPITDRVFTFDNVRGYSMFLNDVNNDYFLPIEHGGSSTYTYSNDYTKDEVYKIIEKKLNK